MQQSVDSLACRRRRLARARHPPQTWQASLQSSSRWLGRLWTSRGTPQQVWHAAARPSFACLGFRRSVSWALLTWLREVNYFATSQDFVTALPDLSAVMLQHYVSASTSSLKCCAMAGEDFIYPATEGVRPEKSWVEKQVGAYMADLLEMASGDVEVFSALMPVRSLHPTC